MHHAMSEVVCVFPAEGTDGVLLDLVSVVARDDGSSRKAEAPGLEEVSHSLFQECLVLEDVPEHFMAVTKREELASGMLLHCGGPFGFVEEAGGETGVEGKGGSVDIPLGILAFCSCFGLKVCLLIARVHVTVHCHGLRSCSSVKGVDSCEDEIWVNLVFQSGLLVAFLPSSDHHAISVDGEGDGGVCKLEGCCHGSELRSGVGEGEWGE
eukprot:2722471-Rhodomonas_salina.1